ncbi:MAG: Gfo/Idh/MocA family oxidoreductase, partial [Propionibacteriaceae bacterium]|nr:Gfo/Idh/MocA family oxidoreductase [Propionibacteriaceae bacterium]
PADFPDVPPGTPWHPSLAAALAGPDRPAVVTLSTPLHTHVALAAEALAAGCDVMLEKPPAPSLAAYHDLTAKVQAAGRLCQVGFQTFGSDAFERIAALVADGAVGALERVGAVGLWVRDEAYWSRAPWSGRRQLDGHPVVDGAVTNPFAHAVATALRLGGVRGAGDVAEVAVDLWRANPIEADDTSAVRVTTTAGLPIALALSTCAPLRLPARVTLYGTAGRIVYFYETDRIEVYDRDEVRLIQASRGPLFDDLLDARNRGDGRLRCALADVGGFMTVLEAVRTAPAVRPIDPAHVTWAGAGPARHAVVHDVEAWAERVAASSLTFTEAGAPWTRPATFLTTCSSEGTAHA